MIVEKSLQLVTRARLQSRFSVTLAVTIAIATLVAPAPFDLRHGEVIAATASGPKPAIYELDSWGIVRFEADRNGVYRESTRIANDEPEGLAFDSKGNLWVANPGTNTIALYKPGTNGQFTRAGAIAGPDTGMVNPGRIALDAKDNLYVLSAFSSSSASPSILRYQAGSIGDAVPVAITGGSGTGLIEPTAIAVDSRGFIYVSNFSTGGRDQHGYLEPGNVVVYQPGSSGNLPPAVSLSPGGQFNPAAITVDAAGNVYVASDGLEAPGGSIFVYKPNSQGVLELSATISGEATGLEEYVTGIAVDESGNIYASTFGDSESVQIFGAGSNGDIAPIATISGSTTGLAQPEGIALDQAGRIYVANESYSSLSGAGNSVTIYSAGSSGDSAPLAALSRGDTSLEVGPFAIDGAGNIYATTFHNGTQVLVYPAGTTDAPPVRSIQTGIVGGPMVVDGTGNLYVLNTGGASILKFAPGATGNAAPEATISGPNTRLRSPSSIAVDGAGNIYVAEVDLTENALDDIQWSGLLLIFSAASDGDVAPATVISGPNTGLGWMSTGLDTPTGTAIAVDSSGDIYAANSIAGSVADSILRNTITGRVNVFRRGSQGNTPPTRQIVGSLTGLAAPMALELGSAGDIYVENANGPSTIYGPGATGNSRPLLSINDNNAKNLEEGTAGFALSTVSE